MSKIKETEQKFVIYESKMNFNYSQFIDFLKIEMMYQGFDVRDLSSFLKLDHKICYIRLQKKGRFTDYEIEKLSKKFGI